MILTQNEIEAIVKGILEEAGISNEKILTWRITNKLVERQKRKAREGLEAAKKRGVECHRPEKPVNIERAKKDIAAGVPFVQIAAKQKVSEQTLRKRLKKEEEEEEGLTL